MWTPDWPRKQKVNEFDSSTGGNVAVGVKGLTLSSSRTSDRKMESSMIIKVGRSKMVIQFYTRTLRAVMSAALFASIAFTAFTSSAEARRARNAVIGGTIGAGVGALVDGGSGARTGAAAGALIGAVAR